MQKSDSIASISAALAKAQSEFAPIAKNRQVKIQMKSGGSFNFRYADLEATINATRPALTKNGLAVIQPICDDKLLTIITHSSGEYYQSSMPLPANIGDDPKQYGAKISYLRRYSYQSMVCVMADDDLDEDGQYFNQESQAQKLKELPTLDNDRFAEACKAVESGKFPKMRLLTEYALTDEQKAKAAAL